MERVGLTEKANGLKLPWVLRLRLIEVTPQKAVLRRNGFLFLGWVGQTFVAMATIWNERLVGALVICQGDLLSESTTQKCPAFW